MKKRRLFIVSLLVIALNGLFVSCSEEGNGMLEESSLAIQDNMINNTKGFAKNNRLYHVTAEDVSKYSDATRNKQKYTMDVYEAEGDTLLYLLNYEKGWMIIAGDKRINPIVAESDTGELTLKTDNETFLTWIDSYADEIRFIKKDDSIIENEYTKLWDNITRNNSMYKVIKHEHTKEQPEFKWCVVPFTYCDSSYIVETIPHLISTKWGQGSPWNSKLPLDMNASNSRCPTGCTAVALSQLIYYMHYFIGKPTGLYHDISISMSNISGPTTNIGFSRSNYNNNSTRWNDMALTYYGTGNKSYVGDLMLDVGNRVGMSYSGTGSGANFSTSAVSYYSLTYCGASYNFQDVKNDLQNSKPLAITADDNTVGHAWIIDGLAVRYQHWVTELQFEYSENWMYAWAYFDTFEQLQQNYDIQDPSETIILDGGTTTTDYLLMNWGWNGSYDNGYYGSYPSSQWNAGGYQFQYNKQIYYNFR